MNKIVKALAGGAVALAGVVGFAACSSDADVASKNMSKDADNFQIYRQIVVYDLFTDTYVLEVKGYCSLGNDDSGGEVTYTCKVGKDKYIKNIVRGGDNKIVFSNQLDATNVSTDHYEVNFKPKSVVPDIRGR